MISTVVSRIFDPFVMLGTAFFVLLWGNPVFFPAILTIVGLPFVLFVIAWKTKFISNWDVRDRKERPKVLWPLAVIECLAVVFYELWFLVPILFAIIGFALISHVWKISGHAMAVGFASGIVVRQIGLDFWWVYLAIPLVCWARTAGKYHTWPQVIAGATYALLFVWFL